MKYGIRDLMENSKTECCICGKKIKGYGNNPWPVANDGRCCDDCNTEIVLPARIAGMRKTKEKPATAHDMKSDVLGADINALNYAVDLSTDDVYAVLKSNKEHGFITDRELQDQLNKVEDQIHEMLRKTYYDIRDIGKNYRKSDVKDADTADVAYAMPEQVTQVLDMIRDATSDALSLVAYHVKAGMENLEFDLEKGADIMHTAEDDVINALMQCFETLDPILKNLNKG